MKKSFYLILTILLTFGLSANVIANSHQDHRISLHNGYSVVFYPIAMVQGNDQLSVLKKTAQILKTFSDKTYMEACGDITINSKNEVRVVIGTIHSHSGCITYSVNKDGFTPTGLTIHSHPSRRTFRANQADVAANSAASASVIAQLRVGQVVATGIHYKTFSKTDLLSKMGYLVADNHLLYQYNGHVVDKGTVNTFQVSNVKVVKF